MADKKAEERKKAKKKLLKQIDDVLKLMGPAMGGSYYAREVCKGKKGESLYDLVTKCKAVLKSWEKDVKALEKSVETLRKMMKTYPKGKAKDGGTAVSIGQSIAMMASNRVHVMSKKMEMFKSHVKEYEAELSKVKVK